MTSTDVRTVRHVPDAERRARLARRHALAPAARVGSPEEATRAMTVLHASEPASVHLAAWARVDGLDLADVEDALYARRTLVKQLAMRRTVFVVPRDLLPAVWPSAAARVAGTERAQMARDVVRSGVDPDGDAWLDRARAAALTLLDAAPGGLAAADVRRAVPMIDRTVPGPPGVLWSAPLVLLHLGAIGDVVRGVPTSHWRTSRTGTSTWDRTARSWSTGTATPARPPGSTGGSSDAGCRTPPGPSRCAWSSPCRRPPRGRSTTRPRASPRGSAAPARRPPCRRPRCEHLPGPEGVHGVGPRHYGGPAPDAGAAHDRGGRP